MSNHTNTVGTDMQVQPHTGLGGFVHEYDNDNDNSNG